ncbi:MAG: PKD domain-containing protein, partial [Candidatus Hydrogenedentales bacterium]
MRKSSIAVRGVLLLAFVAVAATGCPDRRIVFIATPSQLDFGEKIEVLAFNVAIAATQLTLPAFRVVSEVPWVTVLTCDELSDGCTTTGPNDPMTITLRVDRSRMVGGLNEGRIRIEAPGVVSAFVDVSGFTPVVPEFSVTDRTPFIDEVVTFTNETTFAPGWFATDWFWEFRPGETSTVENPNGLLYPTPGSFTVTLRVTATNGSEVVVAEAVRENFIIAAQRTAPTALFEASTINPIVNNPVFFEDRSFPGTAPITSWSWDFGDGGASREQHPTHTYTLGGSFTVSLRVTSDHGSDILVRENFISVVVRPPVADFSVNNRTPIVGEVIQFRDESEPGSAPITSWLWNFGDGGTSTQQNPVKVYTEPGVFSVRLTVTTAHGQDTETKAAFITVGTLPPVADFTADTRRPLVGDPVTFMDTSDGRTAPVTEWFWDFGDGTTSMLEQPVHIYNTTGTFDVSLRVTTEHGEDFILKPDFISVFEGTALDEYVREEDDTFSFFPVRTLPGILAVTGHVLDLTSQTWRSPATVLNGGHIWSHWLVIIEPDVIEHDTALLVVDGGSNDDDAPNSIDPLLAQIAVESRSVVAVVQQVPNQPLQFAGEPLPRSEDEI